jgi:hypothetical protein
VIIIPMIRKANMNTNARWAPVVVILSIESTI